MFKRILRMGADADPDWIGRFENGQIADAAMLQQNTWFVGRISPQVGAPQQSVVIELSAEGEVESAFAPTSSGASFVDFQSVAAIDGTTFLLGNATGTNTMPGDVVLPQGGFAVAVDPAGSVQWLQTYEPVRWGRVRATPQHLSIGVNAGNTAYMRTLSF